MDLIAAACFAREVGDVSTHILLGDVLEPPEALLSFGDLDSDEFHLDGRLVERWWLGRERGG
jgi:hypothetical protein